MDRPFPDGSKKVLFFPYLSFETKKIRVGWFGGLSKNLVKPWALQLRVNLKKAIHQVFDKNNLSIASYNCVIKLHHKITSSNCILQRNAVDIMYLTRVLIKYI